MTFTGTLRPFQELAVDRAQDRGRLLVAYQMGLGKAQPLDEPVLTSNGWSTIGALQVGSLVVARDGSFTKVMGVFPQGTLPVYEVLFNDGSFTYVCGEHLWEVRTNNDLTQGTSRVLSTDEMRVGGLHDGAGNRRYRIPLVEAVQYPDAPLPLDPYLLGVLLGDGGIKYRVIISSADVELLEEVERLLPPQCVLKHIANYDYAICGTEHNHNPVLSSLREMGLFGHGSESKWVPKRYMLGSPRQREAVLQGLLDTDGHARPLDGNIEFTTVSRQLASDVQELVRSLGGTVKIREKRLTPGQRQVYRMSVRVPATVTPFRLSRKAQFAKPMLKYKPTRLIESITPAGETECVCIQIEHSEQLYVTRDYIVTHNTVIVICAVEELAETRRAETGLVVVPASLKYQWAEKIEEFTGDDNYLIIDGTPTQRAEQYERARKLRPRYVILNYEKVRDEWATVSRLRRDFVVTDEATVYKGFTAKVSKRIKRLQPDEGYAFGLTGQPIENRPEDLFSIMQHVDEDVLGRWDTFDRMFIVRDLYGRIKRVKNLPLLWDLMGDAMVRKTRHDPDVAPYMPQVEETLIPVELDRATAKVYRVIVGELLQDLANALNIGSGFDLFAHYGGGADEDANALRGQIMSKLTALRMLCDHPDLVRLSSKLYADENTVTGSEYAYKLVKERGLLNTITRTPKMTNFLEACLLNLEESNRTKIVVFSTFKPTLKWLQESFAKARAHGVIFDGDMNAKQKDTAKRTFTTDPRCRVFLSSDAGGYGVDLPNANYLKNYDLPWSAGRLEQRNSRIIRLSSEFDKVHVENWVIKGSVEERQYHMLQEKMAIASAMVDRKGADAKGSLTLGLDSLQEFLKTTSV